MTNPSTTRRSVASAPAFAEPVDAMLLLCILRNFEFLGTAPTWPEMHRSTGLSSRQSIHRHLVTLRVAGFITWVDGKRRTLQPRCAEHPIHPLPQPQGD